MWITYSGYLFTSVGLTLVRPARRMCRLSKGMGWFLGSYVFLLFYLGFDLKSGRYTLSTGRLLLVIGSSREQNNKWANYFFGLIFVEIILTFQRIHLEVYSRPTWTMLGSYNSKKKAGNWDWKVLLEITYLMSVDYLLLSWMWNYNCTLDTVTDRFRELSCNHELRF